jgi:hypothetical protein
LDSIAYWPGPAIDFFKSLNTNREAELARYDWVIHLDTADSEAFDTSNPIRIENHFEAVELNTLIKIAWAGHPRRFIIPHEDEFLDKIAKAKKSIKMILAGSTHNEICEKLGLELA